MTWTYSGDPAASDRDAVRFLVGDTAATDPLLTDEELDHLLAEAGDATGAAIAAARALLAKFARLVDKTVGDLRVSYSQRRDAYAALVRELERRATLAATPFAGGTSATRKELNAADPDRVQPYFRRGQFDAPGT